MEKIICAAGLRHTGTIFYKSIMRLAYSDDVDIIGRSIREVEAAFSKFAEEARSIGLAVNESKTKLLLSTPRIVRTLRMINLVLENSQYYIENLKISNII